MSTYHRFRPRGVTTTAPRRVISRWEPVPVRTMRRAKLPRGRRAGRRHPMPPGRLVTGVEPGQGQRKRPGCKRGRRARRPRPRGPMVSRVNTSRRCLVRASLLRRVGRRPPRVPPMETEAGEMPRQAGRQEAPIPHRFPGRPLCSVCAPARPSYPREESPRTIKPPRASLKPIPSPHSPVNNQARRRNGTSYATRIR